MRVPRDARGRAIRRAQLDAFVRLVPTTVIVQLLTAAVLVASFRGSVDSLWLGLWFGAAVLACFARLARAIRLRIDFEYARAHPPNLLNICVIVCVLAGLWLIPPIFWFDQAGPEQQLFLCVLAAALISAGSVTMVSVPPVALSYVSIMLIACVTITYKLDNYPLIALSVIYAALLVGAIVTNSRQFIANVKANLDLQERGEIIQLLREFEASGSGGLWELDADLHITNISTELASGIDMTTDEIIGRHARDLLDPGYRASDLSTGMRRLFEQLESGQPFRDLAVPAVKTGRWWSLSGKPLRDAYGEVIGWRGVGSDITDLRLTGDDAVRAARRDPLTGLANRLLVRELLEESILSHWKGRGGCALLLVDLDKFKLVNDTLGHAIGDQLLIEVARRLERTTGGHGSVGRLGGDEFALIWTGPTDNETLSRLADKIIAQLSKTYTIGAASLHIGATIGIARGPVDGRREEQLMRSADLALYRAKEAGRGGYAFFESYMFEEAEDNRLLENDVRDALHGDGLRLAYQPIVDARTGEVVGREALLRWRHPTRGEISPELFVPIIEDAGLIHQIGDWVIREACAEASKWDEKFRVAVNVSAAQLPGAGLAKTVLGALANSGLEPSRLELEVTETVFLGDDASTLASLERLRALGVRLVLDDFGKGYSSFGYLSRAHFSKIKIDQTFVRGAAQGEKESIAIVHAILALANGLDVETTAEGVETERQAKVMRDLGCTQLQGFFFGRPVPPESLVGVDRRAVRHLA
ncbi:EAL domain-containing protein [Sphingomonas rhizophila]|uniref:EAL domain-containing protein n=1 Tax=Sphingomonas rhizophila TaxID=2071607 RepID=A0A7G9SCU3_9SPHN|nr:EAL domain-containing protein [Sphingomonas rhizophila]QNN65668.1 EAL domain-containing protein [Sphingomonas rhizophila]